ncbi:MAG TPA: hypothetical protein VL359_15795 [bacterium]|nr:hypothetical protein [bacterium]
MRTSQRWQRMLRWVAAAALCAGLIAGLGACSSETSLPEFPPYPPAAAYLKEQARWHQEVAQAQAQRDQAHLVAAQKQWLRIQAYTHMQFETLEQLRERDRRELIYEESRTHVRAEKLDFWQSVVTQEAPEQ